jgi:hypothetical protein
VRWWVLVLAAGCGFHHGASSGPDAPIELDSFDAGASYEKTITIHPTGAGSDVTDFPMLFVETMDTDLVAHAASDGSDIAFTDPAGNRLPAEIESYDSGTGAITAWVRVPAIAPATAVSIVMVYGTPQSTVDPTQVWTNGFYAVYHFSETAAGTVHDSTTGHRDGTMVQTPVPGVAGQIGRAIQIAHDRDYVTFGDIFDTPATASWTISMWTMAEVSNPPSTLYARILAREDYNANAGFTLEQHGTSGVANIIRVVGGTQHGGGDTVALPSTTFRYICFRYDGGQVDGFGDGAVNPGSADTSAMPVISKELSLGGDIYNFGPGDTYHGTIDELHLSMRPRPDAWIAVEFANQSDPTAFYTVGAQVVK